jgi:hypothetical protein
MTCSDYRVQWVTAMNQHGGLTGLTVTGYCVRDWSTFNGDTVFEHTDEEVCRKMAILLNEGKQEC